MPSKNTYHYQYTNTIEDWLVNHSTAKFVYSVDRMALLGEVSREQNIASQQKSITILKLSIIFMIPAMLSTIYYLYRIGSVELAILMVIVFIFSIPISIYLLGITTEAALNFNNAFEDIRIYETVEGCSIVYFDYIDGKVTYIEIPRDNFIELQKDEILFGRQHKRHIDRRFHPRLQIVVDNEEVTLLCFKKEYEQELNAIMQIILKILTGYDMKDDLNFNFDGN